MQDDFNHEIIEWGIRRESPYARERKAFNQMEDKRDGEQKRNISNSGKWNNQV